MQLCTTYVIFAGETEEFLPHLIIIGESGVGKSSLGNTLNGYAPDCDKGDLCPFVVCKTENLCTSTTQIKIGGYYWKNEDITIVDTPGLGTSATRDVVIMSEIANYFRDVVKYANTILLLLNGKINELGETPIKILK